MHVVLNMACSVDGRVAGPGGRPVELSGEEDLARVHRLRARSDAVLVGAGTVRNDDPRLTARGEREPDPAEQPIRVVVSSTGRIPEDARVLDDEAQTLVLAADPDPSTPEGAEAVPVGGEDGVDLAAGLDALAEWGVERVLAEGGPALAASLLEADLVDRWTLYVAPRVLGGGPSLAAALEDVDVDLVPRSRGPLGEGTLVSYGVPG